MKILVAAAALCCAAGFAHARPVVIEETSVIQTPDPTFYLGAGHAIDGDDAVIVGTYNFIEDDYSHTQSTAFVFHRSGSTWSFVKRIGSGFDSGVDDMHGHYGAALKNGVAALSMSGLSIYERRNGDWVQAPQFGSNNNPWVEGNGDDVYIEGNRMFFGGLSWGGIVLERNTAGEWRAQQWLYGDNSGLSDAEHGGPVDMAGDWIGIYDEYNDDSLPAPAVTLYRKTSASPTSWVQQTRLVPEPGHSFGDVALRMNEDGGQEMFIPDFVQAGTAVYRNDSSSNEWHEVQRMTSAGEWMSDQHSAPAGGTLTKSDLFVFQSAWDHDRQASVAHVFAPNENGFWVHVATLAGSHGRHVGRISASGRRVLASAGGEVLYFELPETFSAPAVIQDTFATGNGAGWTAIPGSQWTVAKAGDTRVYRQSNTVGDGGAVLDAADWTDQSIQADVTPTAFNGNDRWVGLATRRADAANYYYVTLRSSGIVALKRMRNGQFANLASASIPVALNRTYRLRLESIGTRHRVYVDGVPVLDADDGELARGHAALLTYRAAADFDNVVVTPNATTTIYAQTSERYNPPPLPAIWPWISTGLGSWAWRYEGTTGNMVLGQSSVAGDARVAAGPLNEFESDADQIVETRARVGTFGTGADPWIGVMARYRDDNNYLYLSLRKSNTLSLRRLINGQITQLGTVVQTVTPGTWYRLRLEAVGSRVRVYVNGRIVLEATDPQPWNGRTGLLTYRTAADFDDYRAIRP